MLSFVESQKPSQWSCYTERKSQTNKILSVLTKDLESIYQEKLIKTR